MKMLTNALTYCGILLLAFTFITCSSEDTPTGPSKTLFINGMVGLNMGTVIVADSTIAALTAGFGGFTQYNEINSGNQNFKLKEDLLGGIVTNKNFNISGGKNYTLMAVGTPSDPELLIKEDDLTIQDSSKASIRLINLSANSLPMTMSITAGADLATNVSYKSVSDFTEVQGNNYDLTIKSGSTVVSTINNFNLIAKKKYSVLITGLVNQLPKASYNIIVNK